MYDRDEYRRDVLRVREDVAWTARKVIPYGIGLLLFLLVGLWVLRVASQPGRIVEKVTDADNVISNYEEFQSIHNTTIKLNRDLCNMRGTPDSDPMFRDFSKAQRILAVKSNLDRWIEEYNAKSKMITRSAWKAGALPYQLSTADFNCYEEAR